MTPPSDDFASLMALAPRPSRPPAELRAGQRVEGTIVAISRDCAFLDIGVRGEGQLPLEQLRGPDGAPTASVGDRIKVIIGGFQHGIAQLTLTLGTGGKPSVEDLQLAKESGAAVRGTVLKAVKAGLEVDLRGSRAFCPASQIDLGFTKELEPYVGQELDFRVVELRDGGRSIVLSRRKLLEEERERLALETRSSLELGAEVQAIVRSIQPRGAFLDVGGVDAFLPIGEAAAGRVELLEDVISIGEQLSVKILSMEDSPKGLRVRVSRKALLGATEQPAQKAAPTGQILEATVVGASAYGVLVQTSAGEGTIPLRELTLAAGADYRRAYPEGKQLRVVLQHADGKSGRLRFSVKQVGEVEERLNYREYAQSSPAKEPGALGSLGELLQKKLGSRLPKK